MAYTIPIYIAEASIDTPNLNFVWDDTRVDDDFLYEPDNLLERLSGVSLRAKIAVGISLYEWILFRFQRVSDDPLPFHLAEAAWCANVNREYMEYFELDRDEWLGPVRGPLWCAVTWLLPMIFFSDDQPEEWESGLGFLSRLAFHVMPKPLYFEKWLAASIERIAAYYTMSESDPFEDLFGEREEERRGPLVPREVLDPNFKYHPDMAKGLLSIYLRNVDYKKNPILFSPDEMIQRNFQGTPYIL